jgi:hypothetical protein
VQPGSHHTEEARAKMSGREFTPEHRAKLSAAATARHRRMRELLLRIAIETAKG